MTQAVDFLRSRGIEPKSFIAKYIDLEKVTESWRIRDEFIAKFGFAILTDQAIEAIRGYAPLLEVGAGCGYWAYELRNSGIDIIATEPNPNQKWGSIPKAWKSWIDLENLSGPEAVAKYSDRNLLMCWPSLDGTWPQETLEAFAGYAVLYVGEGEGGCTGNDEFHAMLQSKFEQTKYIQIPQFWGLHDRLTVWERVPRRVRAISLEK